MALVKHFPIPFSVAGGRPLLRTVNIGELEQRVTGQPFLDSTTGRPILKWKHQQDHRLGICGDCIWSEKANARIKIDTSLHTPCSAGLCNETTGCDPSDHFCTIDALSCATGIAAEVGSIFFPDAFGAEYIDQWDLYDCPFDAGTGITTELHYIRNLNEDIDWGQQPADASNIAQWRYLGLLGVQGGGALHWWVAVDKTTVDVLFDWSGNRTRIRYRHEVIFANSPTNPPGSPMWRSYGLNTEFGAYQNFSGLGTTPDCAIAEAHLLSFTVPLKFGQAGSPVCLRMYDENNNFKFTGDFELDFDVVVTDQPERLIVQVPYIQDAPPVPPPGKPWGRLLRAKSLGPEIIICDGITFAETYSFKFESFINDPGTWSICQAEIAQWVSATLFGKDYVVRHDPTPPPELLSLFPGCSAACCIWRTHISLDPNTPLFPRTFPLPISTANPDVCDTGFTWEPVAFMRYNPITQRCDGGFFLTQAFSTTPDPLDLKSWLVILVTPAAQVFDFTFAVPPNNNAVSVPRGFHPVDSAGDFWCVRGNCATGVTIT